MPQALSLYALVFLLLSSPDFIKFKGCGYNYKLKRIK
jgi:hypothetical protein